MNSWKHMMTVTIWWSIGHWNDWHLPTFCTGLLICNLSDKLVEQIPCMLHLDIVRLISNQIVQIFTGVAKEKKETQKRDVSYETLNRVDERFCSKNLDWYIKRIQKIVTNKSNNLDYRLMKPGTSKFESHRLMSQHCMISMFRSTYHQKQSYTQ